MGYSWRAKEIIDRIEKYGEKPDRKCLPLECPRCGKKGYYGDVRGGDFSYKGESFTGKSKFKCLYCGKVFKSRD